MNRQGNDRGLSYRSAIYFVDEDSKSHGAGHIADVEASGTGRQSRGRGRTRKQRFLEAGARAIRLLERIPNGYLPAPFPASDGCCPNARQRNNTAKRRQPHKGCAVFFAGGYLGPMADPRSARRFKTWSTASIKTLRLSTSQRISRATSVLHVDHARLPWPLSLPFPQHVFKRFKAPVV